MSIDDDIVNGVIQIRDAKHLREVLDYDIFENKTAEQLSKGHLQWQLAHYTKVNNNWEVFMDQYEPCNCPQSAVLTNIVGTYDDLLQNLYEVSLSMMTRLWRNKTEEEKNDIQPYLESFMHFVTFIKDINETMSTHYHNWKDNTPNISI
tara:strand:- start:700 stop:1146 length:447 start_codon:yes stop_codon:yes gene_type:complete